MPAQNFSLNEATAPLASVQWTADYETIDLTYNGTLLTRITDAESLRTTGLQGQAADGATLVLRLVPATSGEEFTLERNGARMHPSEVDHTAPSPTAAILYGTPSASGGPTPAQEKAMRSGRRWIRAVGILLLLGAAGALVLASGNTTTYGTVDNAVKIGNTYYDASSLRSVGIGLAVFGLLLILIARFAKGQRAVLMFGIGAALCLLLAVANLISGSPASAVIPGAAGGSALRAWKFAKASGKGTAS